MLKKILIAVLGVALVILVVLFIQSENKTEDIEISEGSITTDNQAAASVEDKTASLPEDSKQEEPSQPDPSLPIPAHQLQKLVDEPLENEELQEKIESANELIEQIQQKLGQDSVQLVEPELPQESQQESVEVDDKSEELEQRIENIKEHLKEN